MTVGTDLERGHFPAAPSKLRTLTALFTAVSTGELKLISREEPAGPGHRNRGRGSIRATPIRGYRRREIISNRTSPESSLTVLRRRPPRISPGRATINASECGS